MVTPFDFLNSINNGKNNLLDDGLALEKEYDPFLANRGLSLFPDTILYANEMNMNSHAPLRLQYEYLLNAVRKRKRISKWPKNILDDDVKMIRKYYKVNSTRAQEIINILDKEQIKKIRDLYE